MLVTRPAPTVRPPSRIANRKPSSIAIGAINDTFISRVVPRHHHLGTPRQLNRTSHIRRPEIELRPIPLKERRMTTTLLLGQHIHLRIKLGMRRNRTRSSNHLTPLHIILTRPPQQQPNIVPSPSLIQQLPKHLHPSNHRLLQLTDTNNLHLSTRMQLTLLHPARNHRPPTP